MTWRTVDLPEALNHSHGRDIDRNRTSYDFPRLSRLDYDPLRRCERFTDGTAVAVGYKEAYAYSEVTIESAQLVIAIFTP